MIAIHDSTSSLGLFATPFIVILVLLFVSWRGMFILVAIASGFLVDRFRPKKIAFLLVLTTGIFTALVAVKDMWWIKIFLFLQATIAAGFFPLSLVAISRMFERETRGQAVGFIITLGVIGVSVIPYLLGLSGDLVSFRLGFLLLGIVTALSSGLLFFVKELE